MACLACHPSAGGVLSGPMATRAAEKRFARRAFGADGDRFFAQSCTGCHVAGCDDCHGAAPHAGARLKNDACTRCHKGYFVGWDYLGRAPREDHARYQRGAVADGEPYLKMLPDVHAERGMTCADCHTMRSLQEGKRAAKTCRECHPAVSRDVPEHSFARPPRQDGVRGLPRGLGAAGVRDVPRPRARRRSRRRRSPRSAPGARGGRAPTSRARTRRPWVSNERGKVAPIRPQFVLFATDTSRGWENRLLAAEWKAFVPHTIRRGTVTCSECHDSPRRYLLEPDDERLYELEKDGLPLRSFWSREKQTVVNGSFFPKDRHEAMNRKTPEYVRQYLRQWQNLLDRAAPPSRR